ncbi:hypothetical protein RCL1_007617 [Eukaryota sp. TZLM3-RCL]
MSVRHIGISTLNISSSSWSRSDFSVQILNPECNSLSISVTPSCSTVSRSSSCTLNITATVTQPNTELVGLLILKPLIGTPLFIPIRVTSLPCFWGIKLKYLPIDSFSPVPQPFAGLLRQFEKSGGYNTPSIFRVAASQESLKIGRSIIQNNGLVDVTSAPFDHPHVLANLIKQFLRDLPDDLTLIPEHPLVEALGQTLARVTQNFEVTKMNAHSLAIVIGPNILRNSTCNSNNTRDQLRLFGGNNHATTFITELIVKFGGL